jgi:hypothetical protein
VVAAVAVAAAIALGVVLRLADPLSNPVIPAEDPYTHMALVREHLRSGDLNPLNPHETLYPPGLHAFLAAAWVFSGADLYQIIRLGPVVFGAIGILGMAVLLWRSEGPIAGFVGALALAVAPEAIFRTTMMSPTALDLALLPFFLYALLEILRGRLAWAGVAAPLAVFLAIAHPWLLAILGIAGLAFLVLALVLPWSASRSPPTSLPGLACTAAILGGGLGLALLMPGFGGVLNLPHGTPLGLLAALVAGLSFLPGAVLLLSRRSRARLQPVLSRQPPSLLARMGWSAGLAATLLCVTTPAIQHGMPDFVDLPRMVGWPVLALAFLALVALPFIASPAATLGASLFAATYLFVIYNPFHSAFLPHRTTIFLVVGLAMLAGVAAGAAARAVTAALARRRRAPSNPLRRARPAFVLAPMLLVAVLLGGSVYAGTPDAYPGGWYRLYHSCELEALRDVARDADAAPSTIVVTGDWESKLVLAALTSNASRIWLKPEFFTQESARGDLVAALQHNGHPVVVVVDRYLRAETPDADVRFLAEPPWRVAGEWCSGMGIEQPRIAAYASDGGAP